MVGLTPNEVYSQYLLNILTNPNAVIKSSRAGMTIGTAGEMMQFDLSQGAPFISTKKVYTRGVIQELVWFLRGPAPDGEMHIDYLIENGCDFWTGNLFDFYNTKRGFKAEKYSQEWEKEKMSFEEKLRTDREFRAINGSLGRPYSAQWRTWRTNRMNSEDEQFAYYMKNQDWCFEEGNTVAQYRCAAVKEHARFKTIDQLEKALDEIRARSDSRRIIVEAWRPDEISNMALPPCHKDMQFVVMGDRLDIEMQQRSCDSFLGVPFNIASYGALGIWAAAVAGLKPGIFTHHLVDTHIYCGDEEQGAWYKNNFTELQDRLKDTVLPFGFKDENGEFQRRRTMALLETRDWIYRESPKGIITPEKENRDHITGVLTQLANDPCQYAPPQLEIIVDKTKSSADLLNTVNFDDFKLTGYEPKQYPLIQRRMPV